MENYTDAQLHQIARKRVEFRQHLLVYAVINSALWALWFFTGAGYPWPVWPMVGWGIGLVCHYLFEYRSYRLLSEEEEYLKLKKQMEKQEHFVP